MRGKIGFVIVCTLVLLGPKCIAFAPFGGDYKGKVIDAETGEPIEGAAVLGVWYTEAATAGGTVSTFYEARETLSDRNGEFTIPGIGVRLMSNITPLYANIFKAGYEYLKRVEWDTSRKEPPLNPASRWEGDKAIVPLKKLTMAERKKRLVGVVVGVPLKKQLLLIQELNKEAKEMGLPLYSIEEVSRDATEEYRIVDSGGS